MHLPPVQGYVFLRVVRRGGTRCEALGDGFLHVGRVVFRQRTLFPGAGVAWERTLRSIYYVYKEPRGIYKHRPEPCLIREVEGQKLMSLKDRILE